MRPVRIFIIDDHPLVRSGLKQLIEGEADLRVCCEAAQIGGAMELITECNPDLAIIDLSLPDGNGMELVKRMQTRHPRIPVLVSSMHDERLFAERALLSGAKGFINKQEASEQVIEAIRQILKGGNYVSKRMQAHLSLHSGGVTEQNPGSRIERLSNRELQIFEMIGQGMGTVKIADKLHLSVKTIETHRANIKRKLGLDSSIELTRSAVQWSLEGH
jgi:DNA-binding NarL/FixJ family response regulator